MKPKHPAVLIATPAVAPPRRKVWSKWLKVVGSTLVLVSFGLQQFRDSEKSLLDMRTQAAELQSRTKQKAIGYETLYWASKNAEPARDQYLYLAAWQYFTGSKAMIETSPGSSEEHQRNVTRLRKAAEDVRDLATFRQYMALENEPGILDLTNQIDGLREPDANAKYYGARYLFLYVVGSVLVVLSQMLGD